MTRKHEKYSTVVVTLLLVVSATAGTVAFVGGATADGQPADRTLQQQELQAAFADTSVNNGNTSEASTDLIVDYAQDDYQVTMSSQNLSADQLAQVFLDVSVQNGEAVVTRNLSGRSPLDANFSGVEPGEYTVNVSVRNGTANDSATINVYEPNGGNAMFGSNVITAHQGDNVTFNVTLNNTSMADVTLGSQDAGYQSTFTVVDQNNDGEVTVNLNTFVTGRQAGAGSSGLTATGADQIQDYELVTNPIPRPLDAGSYSMTVSVEGVDQDLATLVLDESSFESIQMWTAPDRARPSSVDELMDVVSQRNQIAYQDWAVVQIEATGLSGYVNETSDLTNESNGLSLEIRGTSDQMNEQPQEVNVSNAQLLIDRENNQYFLVMDTNGLSPGYTYDVSLTVDENNPYLGPNEQQTLETNFSVVERSVTFGAMEDDRLTVPAGENVTINGTSTVAPGSTFTVEVRNEGGANPFLERDQVTVRANGTWSSTFDLSMLQNGSEFTVRVNDPQEQVTGVVSGEAAQPAEDGEQPAANETSPGGNGTTEAGEETPADGETTADGEGAGVGGNETDAAGGGAQANETAADGDGTTEPGAGEETTEGEETTTEAEETTTTTEETTTNEGGADGGGQPGFGLLAAVLALVLTALLARNRIES